MTIAIIENPRQRAQAQSRAAREPVPVSDRQAFSPTEFAALLGRSPTYGYRLLYSGKVKGINTLGRIMVPAEELRRLMATAETYNPTPRRPKAAAVDGKAVAA